MTDLLEGVDVVQPVEVLIPEARRRHRRRLIVLMILVAVAVLGATIALSLWPPSRSTTPHTGNGDGTGASTSMGRAARIKLALGEYLELQQSVLVPNYDNSSAWPVVTPSLPTGRSGDIHPVEDASGQFSLKKAQQDMMLRAAFAAARKVTTVGNMTNMRTWLPGALATEAAPSDGFEVVGAGAYVTGGFAIISQTAASVTVTARSRTWESQAYQATDGSVFIHTIQNGELDTATLVLVDGAWKVSYDNFTFLPGQGP